MRQVSRLLILLTLIVVAAGQAWAAPCFELAPALPTEIELFSAQAADPQVIWNGAGYAVIWLLGQGFNQSHYMALFDPHGQVVVASTSLTSVSFAELTDQHVVWTGSEYALVWESGIYGDAIRFLRVDVNGQSIGSPQLIGLVEPAGTYSDLRIRWTGSEFGVFFSKRVADHRLQHYMRLNATGQVTLGQTPLSPSATTTTTTAIAWNGSEFGLVWKNTLSASQQFVRFNSQGQMIGTPVPIQGDFPQLGSGFGSMIWTGSAYRVTWRAGGDLLVLYLNAQGAEVSHTYPVSSPADKRIRSDQSLAGDSVVSTWISDDGQTRGLVLMDEADIPISRFHPVVTSSSPVDLAAAGTDTGVGVAWTVPGVTPTLFFQAQDCCTTLEDGDSDGFILCLDCDDGNAATYPGAPQVCDRVNTDCDHPDWPDPPAAERDLDGDGLTVCEGDCDDGHAGTYPGAPQVCDRINTDCTAPGWPQLPADELDADADGVSPCEGDCDDGQSVVFPGAMQMICDGVNNNCLDPAWPALPPGETDADGDAVALDCDNCPAQPNGPPAFDFEVGPVNWSSISAGAANSWHLAGSSCFGDPLPSRMFVSNGNAGPGCADSTSREQSLLVSPILRVPTALPVRLVFDALSFDEGGECTADPTLYDWKDVGISTGSDPGDYTILNDCTSLGDGQGNLVPHSFDVDAWAGQEVRVVFYYDTFDSAVGHTFAVDNVRFVAADGSGQQDTDGDAFGDVCDNCPTVKNVTQGDLDADLEGDFCDTDDGVIYLHADDASLSWDAEGDFDAWNVYRGDLRELIAGGSYTQQPGSNAVAAVFCNVATPHLNDGALPLGSFAFYLVSGTQSGVESDLGVDSSGASRINTLPCP